MEDINSVTIIGRLTKDAELKYTNSGTAITGLTIASNRSAKQNDQWTDEASFFDCSLWGKRGESLNQYLQKGTKVCVTGSLKQDRWEKDGQKRSRVIILVNNIQLLGSNQNNQSSQENQNNQGNWQGNNQYQNQSFNGRPNNSNFMDNIPI